MAAVVDPPESPKRQKSPTEEVETSAEKTETAVEASGCGSDQKNETTRNNNNNNNNKTLEKKNSDEDQQQQQQQQQLSVGCVGVESGVGADETTCNAPEELTTVGKMAEEEAVVAASADEEQRGFDWSEPEGGYDGDGGDEEEEEAMKTRGEEQKCDQSSFINSEEKVQQDAQVDDNVTAEVHEEPNPPMEKQEAADEEMAPVVGDVDASVTAAAATTEDAVAEGDAGNKAKKFRLVCKECGKGFNRRETFNLHRHFHAHEDELMPLTCKECGLTFHHRSSLIKHRNEHREEEQQQQQQQQQLVTPKKEVETRFGAGYECAECGRLFSTVYKLRDHNCGNAVEKPYHCPLCRQEFEYKVSVTKHMITHSQESIFTCQECNQSFPNIMALRYHQRCHTALKPYECPECGMVFKYYSVMEDHRRKHTDNARSHLCNICGKTFKYSSLLHQHQYLHTGQKPFQCPECGKTFAFAQNMKAHCRQHRLRESNSSGSEETCKSDAMPEPVRGMGKENAHQSEESKRSFKCPLCSQTYSAPANLRAHMVFHEAEYETLDRTPKSPKENNKNWDKGFTCPHCPSVYRDESGLNVHMLSVHKSVAQHLEKVASAPPTNQLNLLSSENLQRKLKGVYSCTDCGKRFRHRSVLELHMRIHSKDKPYQCKVCGKGFRFSSYLQQHVIIHTGKKPYKCPDCGKDFAFLQNMRTHQKLHQEKPFRCTSCRKGYSDETQLQHHMLSHNGDKPHKCDLCDKSFGLAYLLRDHMNTHTGERPHRCDECHKTFSWFSSLLVHQKIHARKRQGYTQFNSLPVSARMRVSTLREGELQRRTGQHQTSLISSRMDLQNRKEPWRSQPVQWKVDGGEVMPAVPSQKLHQRSSSWGDSPLKTHTGPTSVHSSDSFHLKESTAPTVPKKSIPSAASETEQHRQTKTVVWSNTPTSTVLASTSSLTQDFSLPVSYSDGAALWSIRPAPQVQANSQGPLNTLGQEPQLPRWPGASASTQMETSTPPKKEDNRVTPSTVSQPEMPWNGCETQKQNRASTSAQLDQSSAVPVSTPVSVGLQKKPVSSGWTNVQSQTTTQKVPISIQYEPHPFGQGMGTPVWGFQSNPVGPQTLLTGQLKPGNQGQELQQQQPMVTGTQIIINQPSPFFSPPLAPLPPLALPGPHPLHSVAVGALPRPPHPNIFFTPQAVMSERPHMPQTMPLPQLTPRTEPHKLGPRLPFAPERLLQCMICGCSLPRELDLQMHYLQHAQGEI